MERIVGATLIVLGVFVFVVVGRGTVVSSGLRSRWMLIFTGIRKLYRRVRPRTYRRDRRTRVRSRCTRMND